MMKRYLSIILTLLCLGTDYAKADTKVSTWSALQTELNNDGTVKLTADITASSSETRLEINTAVTVTLDLNGHVLSRGLTDGTKKDAGQVISINNSSAHLIILDSNSSSPHGAFTNPNSGTFNVTGGVITGGYTHGTTNDSNGGAIRVVNGTLEIRGGTICGNQASGSSGESSSYGIGGAIYLQDGCSFTMTGGSICYNKADITGGVHCRKNCNITLSGGSIRYNVSTYKAGGLAVNSESGESGSFELSGLVIITDNNNSSGACNLYLYEIAYKKIQITGALTGSDIGVSWADNDPYVVFTNGYSTDNSGVAPTTCFHPDNTTNYSIGLQSGEAKITNKTLQNAYAVLSSDGKTLTFYFDTNQGSHSGTIYDVDARTWITPGGGNVVAAVANITQAVFDSSFGSYTFTAGDNWFHGCSSLSTITGINNFNVSQTTNLSWMFAGCSSLTSIDLSSFNTSNAIHFNNMFHGCTDLTNVTIGPNFTVNSNSSGSYSDMFLNCPHYQDGTGTLTISGATAPAIGENIFSNIALGLLVAPNLTVEQLLGATNDYDQGLYLYKGGKFLKFNGALADFDKAMSGVPTLRFHPLNDTQATVTGIVTTDYTGKLTVSSSVAHPTTATGLTFSVTGVATEAFKNQTGVTGITLPATITTIGGSAFSGCTALRYIDMPTATGFMPESLERAAAITTAPFAGVPRQTLIFLNSADIRGENYVYKPGGLTDYYCQRFKIYDDVSGAQTQFSETDGYRWAFENPHDFTAYEVVNTRQLSAGRHYTTCLPYDLPLPQGLQAYTLNAHNTAGTLVGFTEVTGTLLNRHTPYVLIPTASGQLLSTENAVVPAFQQSDAEAMALNPESTSGFTLCGTMRYMDGTDASDLYIMQYNSGSPTWMKVPASSGYGGPCVLPMRAYIRTSGSGARQYTATFTGIDDIMADGESADRQYYDLQGRRLLAPARKGLYISRDGRKRIIK